MTAAPDNLLSQLDDIKGLGAISWWPLAPGWWIVLALIGGAIVAGAVLFLRRRSYGRSWKGDARKTLEALTARLEEKTAQDVAAELSGLLRRIAIKKYSRDACAGLQGKKWLQWLSEKDPRGFDWTRNGILLVEAPYAPAGEKLPPGEVKSLISAAKEWVR